MPFAKGPHSFNEQSIKDNAPTSAGVYGIDGASMIYIGEAENIQKRLLEHHNRDSTQSGCIWKNDPVQFYCELVSGGVLARGTREAELIEEYDPDCNKE